MANPIRHVFLLMLENRSFDHMLGFSGITGIDAQTRRPRPVDGLQGTESNTHDGVVYAVARSAPFTMPHDPGHEFYDVLLQLTGQKAYSPGQYPPPNNTGFVEAYVHSKGSDDPGAVMRCYTPDQLPVLTALAREFVVCDRWHASMPGPTWPNRFFPLAGSSGGLDDSPGRLQMPEWELSGFAPQHGTVFDKLSAKGHRWRIYSDGALALALALKGVRIRDIRAYKGFRAALQAGYDAAFTLIEPNYGDIVLGTYRNGNSQHPLDDVRHGETLIKDTYEAIRSSPVWESSMLIVTWDEHGGFYDHVEPPAAKAPGDTPVSGAVKRQFGFERYGVRVPAVIISPWTDRNLLDGRLHDHASIPATLSRAFGIDHLTSRDAEANDLLSLVTLPSPRADCPKTVPQAVFRETPAQAPPPPDESAPLDHSNAPGMAYLAARAHYEMAPGEHDQIKEQLEGLSTRGEAHAYVRQMEQRISAYQSSVR